MVEITKRWQIVLGLFIATLVFGSFLYTLMSDPDAPLKAGGRHGPMNVTKYKQQDAIIPVAVSYAIVMVASVYYYRSVLFGFK